jgi:hypothetical protein
MFPHLSMNITGQLELFSRSPAAPFVFSHFTLRRECLAAFRALGLIGHVFSFVERSNAVQRSRENGRMGDFRQQSDNCRICDGKWPEGVA